MINLKNLGFALVAVFAFAALSASAASAQGVITSDGPVFIDGTDKGVPTERQLTAFGGETKCETGHYTGGRVNGTTAGGHHKPLNSGSSTFTLTPEYTNCEAGTGLPMTWTMNGCDYVFHIGPTGGKGYTVTADLVCPAGAGVTIDVFGNEEAHAAGQVLCQIHIPAQAGLTGGEIEDEGNGHLTLGGTFEGITAVSTCGHEPPTTENAELHTSATLSGTDAATEGGDTGLSLSH